MTCHQQRTASTAILSLILLVPALAAQEPRSDEFQVNTYTSDYQSFARAAVSPDGGFVISWSSDGSPDDPLLSVEAQRYTAEGTKDGAEFRVNSQTTSWQRRPSIAFAPDGSLIATFMGRLSAGGDTDLDSVQLRRFDSSGLPIHDDLQVNTYTTDRQKSPAIAAQADGSFVVAFSSYGGFGDDTDWDSIQLRMYSAAGTPLGPEFQVNTYTTERQRVPSVDVLPDDSFVVAWQSYGSGGTDSDGYSIQARLFDESGLPLGEGFQVNSYTTSFQRSPSVSASGEGGFVVVWASNGSFGDDTSAYSVQARRFDENGAPVGAEFQLNSLTTSSQTTPVARETGAGDFVVAWQSRVSAGDDSSNDSVQLRAFDSEWQPYGPEQQVNQYVTSGQKSPDVGMSESYFVVTWHSYGSDGSDTSATSIQARLYDLPALFADGFESGDTSAWSNTVP
jgi:hypothetical protein